MFTGNATIEMDTSGGSFGIEPVTASEILVRLVDSSGVQDGNTYYLMVRLKINVYVW